MYISFLILILALILRLNNIELSALGDEGYSLYIAKNSAFSSIFADAGNPPFYYLIIKLEYLLFNFNILGFKATSLIFNLGAIVFVWQLLKNNFNLKTANLAAFICAINSVMIYYSQEIRCYSLTMMLSPLIVYFLFCILQKRENIYYIIYSLLGIIAINTHYYEAIFLFLNFVFGIFYLRTRKKELIKLFIVNFIILLSFLPYFFIVAYKNAFLNTGFNDYLDNLSFSLIKQQISFIFGGILSCVISIVFFFKTVVSKKISRKNKLWLIYFTYIIFATLILSTILSLLIRPMIAQRYYCFLIPLFAAFLSIIFNSYKGKIFFAVFILWLFSIQYCTEIIHKQSFYKTEQEIFNLVENNKHNYIILRYITKLYFETLEGFENVNVITFSTKNKTQLQRNIQSEIKNILEKDKDAVIYTVLLDPDKNNPKAKYTCYYDKKTDLCLLKISN